MITSTGIHSRLKCCAIIAQLALTTSATAQQLYSDSAVAAMTEQSLCMVLPDTAPVLSDSSSSLAQLMPIEGAPLAINYPIYQQCGECFTYSQSYLNFSSLLVWPEFSFAVAPSAGLFVSLTPPPITEYAVGISASSPVHADLSSLPVIAHAAKHLSDLVHHQKSVS